MKTVLSAAGCIIFLLMTGYSLWSQPVNPGYYALKIKDQIRNRVVKADVWYPLSPNGSDASVSQSLSGKLPFVCFGHGYLISGNSYKNIRDTLIEEGYIFVVLKKEKGLLPSHKDMAGDLAFLVENFPEIAEDSIHDLRGRVSGECCLMGHSMGGGAAFLAAAMTTATKALCTLAPFDTNPEASEAARQITIPALIFAGSHDCITPSEKHQLPMFENLKSLQKTYISIKGGNHCQMGDKSIICKIAEKKCRPEASISAKEQHKIINRYLIPWLDFFLKKQIEDGEIFDQTLINDNAVQFIHPLPLTVLPRDQVTR